MMIIIKTTESGKWEADLAHEIKSDGKDYFITSDNVVSNDLGELFKDTADFFNQLNEKRIKTINNG